ncbi:DUF2789 domain-containing protein [Corallincola platygyrae]|uniref:DUF2789 domain-containing protein n=1 Tax=Corallincola platygyrae TaxID=1193278 RepID=A0ABW4XRN7_9GAMM
MYTSPHDLSALFNQLGLPNDNDSIKEFVVSHRIPEGKNISQASFWTPSQASFLQEAVSDDAEWAETVDQLDAMLRA